MIHNHNKNAVAVVATVEDVHVQYREVTHRNMGAGDYFDEEVRKIPYYTYSISYTFEGEEYRCCYNGQSHTGELVEGGQIGLRIDSTNPEYIIPADEKADFLFAGLFLHFLLLFYLCGYYVADAS